MDERIYLRLDGDPLYAPESLVPVGTMREFAVPPMLAPQIAQISIYRDTIPEVAFERVIPDGAARLIFDLGSRRGRADLAGPSTCAVRLRLEGEIANLTVTLRPGASVALLGIPAGMIREQCTPLDEFWPGEVEPLAEQLLVSSNDVECYEAVRAVLAARLKQNRSAERRRVMLAQRALALGNTVREAAERLGIGDRRLQQIFETEVGLSPRQYRRLARIHACLRSLREDPRPRWSELALEHGFFDQAHFSNEFSRVVGLTPTAFVAAISGSSKAPP
ncbi:MAG: helix-turn-helix domain-containing protein [Proteobacteria bacterium]|nr:helix-turn-helix domain-containing protein [Pseudomonadota bacterium]